jgi:hypothetical protein
VQVNFSKQLHGVSRHVAEVQSPVGTKPATAEVVGHAGAKKAVAVNVTPVPQGPTTVQAALLSSAPPLSQASPAPTVFKTIGYVEKAGGQLEAIILQENQVQVVHIGEHIAGRYLVTKITPDLVGAVDETLVQSPMAKIGVAKSDLLAANVAGQPPSPPSAALVQPADLGVTAAGTRPAKIQEEESVANSLGYVQQADGRVETVVADGESVRLIPETPAPSTMAQATPPADLQQAVPPTQDSEAAVAPVSSTMGATADDSIHSVRLPEGSAVRQASYPVPTPAPSAADSPGPSRFATVSFGGAADVVNAESKATTGISTAQPTGSTDRLTKLPVEIKPLGFVVKADGQFAAILSQDDQIYIVGQGDRFAGRYRALSVSADAVEAAEEPPRQAVPLPLAEPPAFPDSLSASAQQGPSLLSSEGCLGCKSNKLGEVSANLPDGPPRDAGILPVRSPGHDGHATSAGTGILPAGRHEQVNHATFIFQTLGYVQTENGELQAIVADGPQIYLVKQGETFAGRYRAMSVDPILVLAVKAPSEQDAGDFLSTRTESGDKSASNDLYAYLQFPHSDGMGILTESTHGLDPDGSGQVRHVLRGIASGQTFHQVDASGGPVFADLGVDLFNSASTGLVLDSHFFMADNPKVGF